MANTKAGKAIGHASGTQTGSTGRPGADTPQTRLNVNINSQTAGALKDYAEQHGVSITEAVRRLVAVGDFIATAQEEGKQVVLRQGDETERVVFTY
ncbi:hypothetical protein [Mycobacteroides chelonae]|uniref:hypothetical protein n=1 Tax=Mycobacteroides chelonae TaxID=1774 RepID=UPI0008A867F7|nr:hypothetical protein [Mycobacteroides chelonae]AYM40176.1 hypothetical protein DYE20_00215 [[Mycobacterium] chelonae subsp. gwanakae]OHU15771.1 hypothetical protein BKG75_11900 [Mycobacteroides chelonae]